MNTSNFSMNNNTAAWKTFNFLLGGIALTCVAAVAFALVSQYAFNMQPCPWCVLQRIIFLAIALACLIGLIWRRPPGRLLAGLLGLLLALTGVVAALWQHFYAAASASCNLTLADRIIGALDLETLLPYVFAVRASCADAAVSLLGVSYDFWSLALFVMIGIASVQVMRRARKGN